MDEVGVGTPTVDSVSTLDVDSSPGVTSFSGKGACVRVRIFLNGQLSQELGVFDFCDIHVKSSTTLAPTGKQIAPDRVRASYTTSVKISSSYN